MSVIGIHSHENKQAFQRIARDKLVIKFTRFGARFCVCWYCESTTFKMTFEMIRCTYFLLSLSAPLGLVVCVRVCVRQAQKLCHCTQKIEYNEHAQTVGLHMHGFTSYSCRYVVCNAFICMFLFRC